VEGLTVVEVDECFHIFNPVTQRVVALNETASNIWRLSTGELGADEIVSALAEHYSVEAHDIDQEVRKVIGELTTEGLLLSSAAR
jgi:hypothetical protein